MKDVREEQAERTNVTAREAWMRPVITPKKNGAKMEERVEDDKRFPSRMRNQITEEHHRLLTVVDDCHFKARKLGGMSSKDDGRKWPM